MKLDLKSHIAQITLGQQALLLTHCDQFLNNLLTII